ncbi:hypothetical protein GCM10023205_57140 [Yinghuangia aomiensis]|uniref:Abortive infection C-terminus n=1 Tax=Yinghuangia aomiensis TaxID=676205 RepID=A0ABP9HXB6_9ACTN
MSAQHITELTRRHIADTLHLENINWAGRMDDAEFLGRLYDLQSLESHDSRFRTAAGDIIQHTCNNDDWERDWVFGDSRFGLHHGSDKVFLAFLAETLHPVVRNDPDETAKLLKIYNDALAPDGYTLVQTAAISGRALYGSRQTSGFHGDAPELRLDTRPVLTDSRVLHEHLARIRDGLDRDPAAAISSSKELVESLFKLILERSAIPYDRNDDIPKLYKKVADLLALKAESVPSSARGSETAQKILRTLTTTVQSLTELRNELGLGHGRSTPSPALARHARLALNATVAITEFLLDTWQDRVEKGDVTLVA